MQTEPTDEIALILLKQILPSVGEKDFGLFPMLLVWLQRAVALRVYEDHIPDRRSVRWVCRLRSLESLEEIRFDPATIRSVGPNHAAVDFTAQAVGTRFFFHWEPNSEYQPLPPKEEWQWFEDQDHREFNLQGTFTFLVKLAERYMAGLTPGTLVAPSALEVSLLDEADH